MQSSNLQLSEKDQSRKRVDELLGNFSGSLQGMGIHDASKKLPNERSIHEVRKSRDRRDQDGVSVLTLKETDGVLRWEHGSGFQMPYRKGRRMRRGSGRSSGHIIRQFKFENLAPNQVDEKLRKLDESLNEFQGFWELSKDPATGQWIRFKKIEAPVKTGAVMLIIHGTFSNPDNNLSAFNETSLGVQFLDDAQKKYKQIIVFGHPTVAVSPFTNAVALATFFRDSSAAVDVICHSRGGLVARWWNEVIETHSKREIRVAYLGSTLGGTSLASPHQLKSALNLLSNISRGVTVGAKAGSALFPPASGLMVAALGINRIFASVVAGLQKTPIIDAGIALVPGLNGQSRQGGNSEILALRENFAEMPRRDQSNLLRSSLFLSADFEPVSNHPWWKFWKYFNKGKIADFAADRIFPSENDLVVDTQSMNEFCDPQLLTATQLELVDKQTFRFPSNSGIHHLNYLSSRTTFRRFRQFFF